MTNRESAPYRVETSGAARRVPPPGRGAMNMGAQAIGITFRGLLTVALDLYLGGSGDQVWAIALCSGGIFLGGLLVRRVLARQPRIRPH